jgi:tetratricopeptide (TPR) repeat protein
MRAIPSILAAGLLLSACAAPRSNAAPTTRAPASSTVVTAAPATVGGGVETPTDKSIDQLQARIKESGGSAEDFATLGAAYLQKWRDNGDPGYYAKADPVLKSALSLDPANFDALTEMGALAASRHDFATALDWANEAIAINPGNSNAWGVKGDALVELGRYPEAIDTVQHMVNLRPDLSSYSRVSYLRELMGDVPNAIAAMQQAVRAGGLNAENTNWCRYQLGMLYFNSGQLDQAEAQFREALYYLPGYVHAEAGLAAVLAARGDLDHAIDLYETAIRVMPFPQYIIELGDVYQAAVQPDNAQRQFSLVEAMEQLYQANGVNVDMELALFDADHQRNLDTLVDEGRRGVDERPGILGHDALAWSLYQAGQYQQAEAQEAQALSLGMKNALMFFHAGEIELALGHAEQGQVDLRQALAVNPSFSLRYAPKARTDLGQ